MQRVLKEKSMILTIAQTQSYGLALPLSLSNGRYRNHQQLAQCGGIEGRKQETVHRWDSKLLPYSNPHIRLSILSPSVTQRHQRNCLASFPQHQHRIWHIWSGSWWSWVCCICCKISGSEAQGMLCCRGWAAAEALGLGWRNLSGCGRSPPAPCWNPVDLTDEY